MAEQLSNAPVLEALCEIRYEASADWDWTLPGQFYDQIKGDFPKRQTVTGVEFRANLPAGEASLHSPPDKVQMRREDGTAVIQVGPGLFAVNHLAPYPSWPVFRSLFLDNWSRFGGLAGEIRPIRIGLRYINRIDPDDPENIRLEDYFTVTPQLDEAVDRPIRNFHQRYEFEFGGRELVGVLIQQCGLKRTGPPDHKVAGLMLDLDFFSDESVMELSSVEISDWMDFAHENIETVFLASLNPEFLETLR